jgi:NAD(P)-dependent dehydrogenase (short-subunit alcohol dehydrogenase family)
MGMPLSDRVAVVTGATGPLGRALATTFAAEGCRLGLIGTDEDRLTALAAELGLDAASWVAGVGDLRRADEARAAVEAVTARFGRVDALLHAVGGYAGGTPVARLDPAEIQSMLDQHLWTTLNAIQAVLPGMVERGWGRIVAVSTPVAANPVAKMSPYSVAKAAEDALIRAVAKEAAGTGVTANVVLVKKIDSDHERETAPSPKNAGWTTPEEIAAVMRQLCTDDAAPINGARIPLDGGG